jgi:aerobic carbon-monoxide dehydrogenase large subunit
MATLSPQAPPRRYVGESVRRREDVRFLSGTATYVDDIELPNAAHVAFVRSPHGHARLGAVDVRRAARSRGVLRVFTAADLPNRNLWLPARFRHPEMTATMVPHPIFAAGAVRYVGQVVAAVVAESRAAAEDAADLVEVQYDPLDAILDVRQALDGKIRLHAGMSDNVFLRYAHRCGDPEKAFATAAKIVERTVKIPRVAIAPMEPRGTLASYDAGTDLLTIWCSAQDPHRHRTALAASLERPEDRIHLIVPDVGGGFGQKSHPQAEVTIAAYAAIALRRPVKWIEDRHENLKAAHHGRGIEVDAALAISAEGRFLALRAGVLLDCGAYVYSSTPNAGHTTASLLSGVYDIPAADVTFLGLATNKVPTSPYRGAGRPEAAIVIEALVDRAARELNVDPIELRRRNLIQPDRFPYESATGCTYDSGNYPLLLERLETLADLPRLREAQALARLEGRLFGIGIGMYVERSGGSWESAAASIEPGGRVLARIGSSPHGQGHETSFAQVIADTLDVPIESVVVRWGDTSEVPRGVGTFAGRSMTMGGGALHVAGLRLREKALALAAHLLGVPATRLVWERGRIHVAEDTERALTLVDLAAAANDPSRIPPGSELGLSALGHFAAEYGYSSGAHLAVVEIDRATGKTRVLSLAAVDDAGTVVNPLLAEGQVVGGIAQGIGEALFEEVEYDEAAQPRAASFLDYALVTAVEMPPVKNEFCPSPSPIHPLGIKGVGEGGACGPPPAIANAVADALSPLRVPPLDMPFTDEKVWRAIHTAEANR